MKVTVCFGHVRIVVPCGNGDVNVGELREKACARYRKAMGKDSNYGIQILKLGSAVDGGILDWDDLVSDVIEDKEKLIAVFEEEDPVHADWDLGSITSSEGRNTSQRPSNSRYNISNDEYGLRPYSYDNRDLSNSYYKRDSSLEVDVSADALKSSTHIIVRRESDPSINLSALSDNTNTSSMNKTNEISVANGNIYDPRSRRSERNNKRMSKKSLPSENYNKTKNNDGNGHADKREQSHFRRDASTRQSMASGLSESFDNENSFYNPLDSTNDDYINVPVRNGLNTSLYTGLRNRHNNLSQLPWFYKDSQEMYLSNNGSLSGIQVVSYNDFQSKKFAGLLINSIDHDSRIGHETSLSCGDVIVEVNEHALMDFAFEDAKAILTQSLNYPEIQLRILPVEERERNANEDMSPTRFSQANFQPVISLTVATPPKITSSFAQTSISEGSSSQLTSAEPSNSEKSQMPMVAQLSYDTVSLYTRKIGYRINVQLKKDIDGLGFSITTRDTTMGEPGPIYIKNILPKGAAIHDKRLQAGDRLLEVNGEDLVGKSQEEVVSILRGIESGQVANITVSRQTNALPRKLKDDPDADKITTEDRLKEHFMFDIALNDTGSAGLGISLKGNQSKRSGKDLGIFVKSVFHGGAAWQDGRLKPNDQLVEVNGHSLCGVSNHEAIDILRASMSTEGNVRGMIEMVIARRKLSQDGLSSRVSSEASSDISDSVLDQIHTTTKPAYELVCDGPLHPADKSDNDLHTDSKLSVTSFTSSDSAQNLRIDSSTNPDVIIGDDDWPHTVHEPFSRESTIRQSISEKRRDTVQRYPYNSDVPRPMKSKINSDSDLKKKRDSDVYVGQSPHKSSTIPKQPGKLQKNNNNSTYNWLVPQSGFRKSVSTESLVASPTTSNGIVQQKHLVSSNSFQLPNADVDVGPSLGIAKSSSLESLQTAVESYVAKNNPDSSLPIPRPLPKVVRGRILNDSFRAALDQSYDISSDLPTLKHMTTSYSNYVREEDSMKSSLATSSDETSRLNKKRQGTKGNKLFGLFRINKVKRASNIESTEVKIAENELHKRDLEARREKDFERMKEENERIQAKARELRSKQTEGRKKVESKTNEKTRRGSDYERPRPPSVPVTSMHRVGGIDAKKTFYEVPSGRHSVDPYVSMSHQSNARFSTNPPHGIYEDGTPPPPPRAKKHSKQDNRGREPISTYNSLPRQPRRDVNDDDSYDKSTSYEMKPQSTRKFDNREFYNRQKPSSSRKKDQSPLTIDNINDTPLSSHKPHKGRSLHAGATPTYSKKNNQQHYHHREQSPEPPPQNFYVIQDKKHSTFVAVHRGSSDIQSPKQTNYRHSIYTDQPSNYVSTHSPSSQFPQRISAINSREIHRRRLLERPVDIDNMSSAGSNRTSSPTISEVAEKNRSTYYRLMQPRHGQLDDSLEKIEVSVPYNL